jgi:hypothetical protein
MADHTVLVARGAGYPRIGNQQPGEQLVEPATCELTTAQGSCDEDDAPDFVPVTEEQLLLEIFARLL